MRRLGNTEVTVTRRERQKASDGSWARDSRGNAVYAELGYRVPGCSLQPSDSSEDRGEDGSRDQVVSGWTLYAPLSFPGTAKDSVRIGSTIFEIVGDPLRWEHPRIGHKIVTLREVVG